MSDDGPGGLDALRTETASVIVLGECRHYGDAWCGQIADIGDVGGLQHGVGLPISHLDRRRAGAAGTPMA